MSQASNSQFSDSHRFDSSPSQTSEEQSEHPTENPLQVEAYADRLMDDVFADVERVASGGSRLPAETAQPSSMQLKSVQVPSIVLSPQWEAPPPAQPEATETTSSDRSRHAWQIFDRILLASAGTALVLMLGLWLGARQQVRQLVGMAPKPSPENPQENANAPAPAGPESATSKEEFQEYLRRSLAAIEQNQEQQQQRQASQRPAIDPQTISQVTQNPELAEALNRLANAIERSNLQASMPSGGLSPMSQSLPPVAQQPATPLSPPPAPTPAASPSPTPVASQPSPQTASPSPSPTPSTPQTTPQTQTTPQNTQPSTPKPAPSPSPAPTTAASPTTTQNRSDGNHILVGIMELGDRSAGLFEINGVARRIRVGQTIGSSGWTLEEVKDGEAVIRRNGEVRSIYVGEQF